QLKQLRTEDGPQPARGRREPPPVRRQHPFREQRHQPDDVEGPRDARRRGRDRQRLRPVTFESESPELDMNLRRPHRSASVRTIALLGAAIAGIGTGIYLTSSDGTGARTSDAPVPAFRRFALTAFDAKDQIEAPSLACDAAGRVYLAWASKSADNERTVF